MLESTLMLSGKSFRYIINGSGPNIDPRGILLGTKLNSNRLRSIAHVVFYRLSMPLSIKSGLTSIF